MPGSGKSTIGKKVAEVLSFTFIDPDKIMEKQYGASLPELLTELGDEAFLEKEYEAIKTASRGRNQCVIATGGSIVYSDEAMEYLRDISYIVHLYAPLDILTERIGNLPRGIMGGERKSLSELYTERMPLYDQYANVRIDTSKDLASVVEAVVATVPVA